MQNAECRMQNEGICFADDFLLFSERGEAKAKILRIAPLSQASIRGHQNYFQIMPEGHTTILHFAFCILHSTIPPDHGCKLYLPLL